jgi:hypothetical protein
LKGFPVSWHHAVTRACLTLWLSMVLWAAYAGPLTPVGQTTGEPPPQEFGFSARHTFPLKLRISSNVNPYMLPTNFGEGLGTLRWEVSGEGKLWDEDPGTLQLRFGTFSNVDNRDNFIEYSQSDFRVTLGEQSFSLSPLVSGDINFGLDAQGTLRLTSELSLDAHVLAYTSDDGGRFGLRIAAPLLAETEASINVLANPGRPDTLLSGQLHIFPEVEGLETLDLEVEYGLQLSAAPTHQALDISANLAEEPHSASLSYEQTEAGYGEALEHSSNLKVDGELQLNDVPEVNASVRLRQEVRHEAHQSLSDAFERYNLQIGGTLSGNIEGVDLSLEYDNRNEVMDQQGTSSQRNDLSFGVGVPISDGFYMYQSLEWGQELELGELYDSLLYSVEADLPVLGGNARPQIALGYNLQDRAVDSFDISANYFGLITDAFDLFAGSGLYLDDETFFYLIAGGSYGFEDGQALSFNASVFLFSDFEPLVELGLGYSLPIDVPLGHRRSVQERHAQGAFGGPPNPH